MCNEQPSETCHRINGYTYLESLLKMINIYHHLIINSKTIIDIHSDK